MKKEFIFTKEDIKKLLVIALVENNVIVNDENSINITIKSDGKEISFDTLEISAKLEEDINIDKYSPFNIPAYGIYNPYGVYPSDFKIKNPILESIKEKMGHFRSSDMLDHDTINNHSSSKEDSIDPFEVIKEMEAKEKKK